MFKEETLFILGAGASYPYGFPLGKSQIKEIIHSIESDVIYFPSQPGVGSQELYQFEDYINKLKQVDSSDFDLSLNPYPRQTTYYIGKSAVCYLIINLMKFDIFLKLRQALIDFDPVSIDSFLRDHPSHKKAGKIMIIYCLLKCENKATFAANKKKDVENDNWYSYLINDILSGYKKPNELLKNKFNIITFNYSVDLDYCLYNKLRNVEVLRELSADISLMAQRRIHHVYGQIRANNIDDIIEGYGEFHEKKPGVTESNTKNFLYSISNFEQIKIIPEERQSPSKKIYKQLIKKAKEIIIIGFSFDRDNLDILGFPKEKAAYMDFFKNKRVKYMDFEGRMNSLHMQFSRVFI